MAEKYFVQYWEVARPENVQEDVFPNLEEAQAFYNELMDNNPDWDACIIGDDVKEFLGK